MFGNQQNHSGCGFFHILYFYASIFLCALQIYLGLKSPGLESLWLKSLWLKSLVLKGPGLKLGVEKSGVEMSFNRSNGPSLIELYFYVSYSSLVVNIYCVCRQVSNGLEAS